MHELSIYSCCAINSSMDSVTWILNATYLYTQQVVCVGRGGGTAVCNRTHHEDGSLPQVYLCTIYNPEIGALLW